MFVAHDVLRLQIAMDDALGMGAIEGATDLLHHRNGIFRREFPLPPQYGSKVFPVDELHADEANALGLAEVEDADDVLMRDVAGENQLLLKALQDCRIGSQFRADDLKRNKPVKLAITGLIDRPHAPLAEDPHNFIAIAEEHTGLQPLKSQDAAG